MALILCSMCHWRDSTSISSTKGLTRTEKTVGRRSVVTEVLDRSRDPLCMRERDPGTISRIWRRFIGQVVDTLIGHEWRLASRKKAVLLPYSADVSDYRWQDLRPRSHAAYDIQRLNTYAAFRWKFSLTDAEMNYLLSPYTSIATTIRESVRNIHFKLIV